MRIVIRASVPSHEHKTQEIREPNELLLSLHPQVWGKGGWSSPDLCLHNPEAEWQNVILEEDFLRNSNEVWCRQLSSMCIVVPKWKKDMKFGVIQRFQNGAVDMEVTKPQL
jgi:hypothetical protein